MKKALLGLFSAHVLVTAGMAQAQTASEVNSTPPLPAPSEPTNPGTLPSAPVTTTTAPPLPHVMASSERGICVLGDYAGFTAADAETSRKIVCKELAKANTKYAATPAAVYQITLSHLGRSTILSVAAQEPAGTNRVEQSLSLAEIEEIPVAAPRLAEAIVNGKSIEETQLTNNVVGEEARIPKTQPGKIRFGLGLIGLVFLDHARAPAPGAELALYYEAERFAAGVSMRGAGRSSSDSDFSSFFALSLGGRYFLSQNDVTPFVGGGLAWSGSNQGERGTRTNGATTGYDNRSGSGLGAFGEVGIEALRTHRSRLLLGLRLDLPFYDISSIWGDRRNYALPLSLFSTFFF